VPDNLPSRRIDRAALEKILQRAAELQAGEVDTSEEMTEADLLKLGTEVGIDGRFLRQAMYEQTALGAPAETGLVARWFGPGTVRAGRVIPGDKAALEEALAHWMAEGEALSVKRRMSDRTVWERQKGFFAEMKRGFGVGGKNYHLAKAHDVTVAVTQLEPGFCHVELTADISHQRSTAVGGSVAGGGAIAMLGVILLVITSQNTLLLDVVASLPMAVGATVPFLTGKSQLRRVERMQLALEQVLDRLEHGEIRPRNADAAASPLLRFAADIRKAIQDGVEQSKNGPRRLKP
jgi:hypothetical protein